MAIQQAFPKLNTPFVDEGGVISIPWYRFLIALWNRTGGSSGGTTVDTGVMVDFGGGSIPSGWLECDGTAVGRVQYSALFQAIGTTWGIGDGSTTFNLPDLRDRTSVGRSGTKILGSYGGASTQVLTVAMLPAHSHTITDPGHNHTQNAHSHLQQVFNNNVAGVLGSQGSNAANNTSVGSTDTTVATNIAATTGITVDNTGNGTAVPTQSPYAAVRKIIKT